MATKKLQTISIKGKDYVLVKDRVLYFNETYPFGSIQTERTVEWDLEIIKATVIPDCSVPERKFTWYSQAKWGDGYINKTSALENAETSAVGRALAFMGIWVIESIASADEINKTTYSKTEIEDDKPRFNDGDLLKLSEFDTFKKFENADKCVRAMRIKRKVNKAFEQKIRELFDNSEIW